MLAFSTEFPVKPHGGKRAFVEAIKYWILKSPHTNITTAIFKEKEKDEGAWEIESGRQKLKFLIIQEDDTSCVAFSNSTQEEELEWKTEVVYHSDGQVAWVSVRTSCESLQPARVLPPAKKPIIVSTILRSLGGAGDGDLSVSDVPYLLNNNDIDTAARIILGDAGCRLPIIYVSSLFAGGHSADANALASDCAGMAHVVVEPNRAFSQRLKISSRSQNVYGGAIGIYWPDGGGRRTYFFESDYTRKSDLKRAINEEIRNALLNRRPLFRCTWAFVQDALTKRAIGQLIKTGSLEVDDYVTHFDTEMKIADEKLKTAESEIARLKHEVRLFEAQSPITPAIDLSSGDEQSYFSGEIVSLILDAIANNKTNLAEGSRKRHLTDAILDANKEKMLASIKREELKRILKDYRTMTRPVKSGLESLGFVISEDGKHYKLLYQNDPRYTFTLSKSSSDTRAGLNMVSDIAKMIY